MKKALIVEDDRAIRKLLSACLDHTNKFTGVDDTESGEDAIAIFKPGQYSIAVIDLCLGQMTGVDVALKIREQDRNIVIVAITGHSEIMESCDVKSAGFDVGFIKPIGYLSFLKFLDEILI